MKIIVGLKTETKIFGDTEFNTVKEIEYRNVDGFTYEYHEGVEVCTENGEQCLVIWFDESKKRATFPISTIAYVRTK